MAVPDILPGALIPAPTAVASWPSWSQRSRHKDTIFARPGVSRSGARLLRLAERGATRLGRARCVLTRTPRRSSVSTFNTNVKGKPPSTATDHSALALLRPPWPALARLRSQDMFDRTARARAAYVIQRLLSLEQQPRVAQCGARSDRSEAVTDTHTAGLALTHDACRQ